MAIAALSSAGEPMGEINTTPLIDVMLVLLILIIMTIPIGTHSLQYDLPTDGPGKPHSIRNKIVVTRVGAVQWNGTHVSDPQLAGLLARVRTMNPEPEVQFEPEAFASYERSAEVLRIVKTSRVTRFGFVGNERYREFARDP